MKQVLSILLVYGAITPGFAEDLPGVNKPKQIVQPAPDPIDERSGDDKNAIRVGDWDVNVSGSVIVDIGAGGTRKPPR